MSNGQSSGIGFMEALFLIFFGLKLGHVINWPWWVVFAPFWGPLILAMMLFLLSLFFEGLAKREAKKKDRRGKI